MRREELSGIYHCDNTGHEKATLHMNAFIVSEYPSPEEAKYKSIDEAMEAAMPHLAALYMQQVFKEAKENDNSRQPRRFECYSKGLPPELVQKVRRGL